MDFLSSDLSSFAYVNNREAASVREIFEIILDEQNHHRKRKEELITLKVLELLIISERVLKLGNKPITNVK